jgi:hypothetical protein
MNNTKIIEESFDKLKEYCEKQSFKGYDPYDGLNSTTFNSIPFISSNRLARLAWIQFFKRSPINLRSLSGVSTSYNAKALGLFLSGYCALYKNNQNEEYLEKINLLIGLINNLQTPNSKEACWGYNFDWQARFFFQPKHTPNIVVSTFVANGLLDAFEILNDRQLLLTARSTCNFILHDLNRTYNDHGDFCFSYTPKDEVVVYNATLLGSRLLARVYSYTEEKLFISEAKKSVSFACMAQKDNGSWGYGNLHFNQWVDNFHTGYNLECIADYIKFSGDNTFQHYVDKGFDYYINTFFTDKGIAKYYNNSMFPIDVHSPAQLVVTLIHLNKVKEHKSILEKVLLWTIQNMQDSKGFFYYQKNKFFLSKISYMRWSQAWMFYALSYYLSVTTADKKHTKDIIGSSHILSD